MTPAYTAKVLTAMHEPPLPRPADIQRSLRIEFHTFDMFIWLRAELMNDVTAFTGDVGLPSTCSLY
jgi:hypothetical protein